MQLVSQKGLRESMVNVLTDPTNAPYARTVGVRHGRLSCQHFSLRSSFSADSIFYFCGPADPRR